MDRALLRRAVRYCVVVFVIARFALCALGLAVGTLSSNPPPPDGVSVVPQVSSGLHNMFDGTERLDAAWFIGIARDGYDAQPAVGAAFFPGYPIVIHLVDRLPGVSTLGAALLVSNLSLLGALIILYTLTTRELSELMARRTVAVLMAFPTSFFLLAPYSESLFLFLSVLALALARRERWGYAGASGAAAAATRLIGLAIGPAIAFEAWRRTSGRERRNGFVAACAVAIGPLLYGAWWQARTGSFLQPIAVQDRWHRTFQLPPVTLARGLYQGWSAIGSPDGGYWVSDAVLTGVAIAGLIAICRRIPGSYLIYSIASLMVPLSYPYLGRDLTSVSRFVVVIFPAFWGMARWTQRRWVFATWLAVSIPLALWHALLFMHYRHIY